MPYIPDNKTNPSAAQFPYQQFPHGNQTLSFLEHQSLLPQHFPRKNRTHIHSAGMMRMAYRPLFSEVKRTQKYKATPIYNTILARWQAILPKRQTPRSKKAIRPVPPRGKNPPSAG